MRDEMVVPHEKENSKMGSDKHSRSSLRDILRDNLYMCEQSILKSRKILDNMTEKSDLEKHQQDILKLLSRMKANVLQFESTCNGIEVDKVKPFKFVKRRSVLSLKRSNNNSTEETDVELVGSSMHNNSPPKGCSNTKQKETNVLAKVEDKTTYPPQRSNPENVPVDPIIMDITSDVEESSSNTTRVEDKATNPPKRSNTENVPVDPIIMDITSDVEETSPNTASVLNFNPIVIIANDVTDTQEHSVMTNGTCDMNSQKLKRSSSICIEHAGSITVPSDDEDEDSDEDPIPFSRFDAQEPPDEALDLEPSQNSLKIEDETIHNDEKEVVTKQDTAVDAIEEEEEKNNNNLEKENSSVEDEARDIGTEDKDDFDLLVEFPSSSQEKIDLLQLLTDKEKQDARDALDAENALKEISDEDSSDSDDSDADAASADCPMTEFSDTSSGDESDTSDDDERKVTKENESEHNTADHDQDSEISSQESQDIQRFISTVRECSVSLQRFDQMSDDEVERLCLLHNVNKRKCNFTPHLIKAKRVRKLSTTSDSSDDSFSYDFKEDPTDLGDLLPGSPIQTSGLLDDILCHTVCTSESSETETDLESDTDMEKSQKKKNETDDQKIVEEKKQSEKILSDNAHDAEEGEDTQDSSDGANKLDSWRNDPLLRQRLWSDSEDKESDSQSAKGDAIVPKTEEDEETIAKNYKPKLRSFVIEDDTDDEDPLEGPTVISDSMSDSSSDSDIEFVDEQNVDPSQSQSQPGRRNIRAVLTDEELTFETQRAKKEEDERIERLESRSRTLSSIHSQRDEVVLDYDLTNGQPQVVVDQGLRDHLKPHQIEGVKFMWEACYESVKMLKTSPGGGCILAHCMGLGKTLQIITLIHTLFMHERSTGTRHVLIVCPLSTVLNWKNEFKLASEKTHKDPNIKIHIMRIGNINQKCAKVKEWRSEGGVIIMGYEAYEMLSNEKQADRVSRDVYETLQKALVNPGPDLVVCDEGHLIKNGKTLRNKALMRINTKRRIILTGTPLQNNLNEYYYMVEFVKPRLLGTLQEYKNRFGDPIMNGQFHNSTPNDIKVMKQRNHVLTKLLKKTIQRVESSVLKRYLPEIMDYTLFVNLTPLQISHYKTYINMMRGEKKVQTSFFNDFRVTNYIGLHPYTVIRYNENSKKKKQKEKETIEFDEDHPVDNITSIAPEWWKECTPEDVSTKVEFGSKLAVVWAILEESLKLGDKILIFSSSLVELDCLEHFLHMHGVHNTPWKRNTDYFRMDGTVPPQTRAFLCNEFNNGNNKQIKAFLISHNVGGLGLNLIAANRVILLEANHNPSHDLQCVYRIFRFGQIKKCFVYRLISNGTMEEKVYRKCVVKLAVASTVVDKYHVKRHYSSGDLATMYAYDFEQFQSRPVPSVPKDKLLATLLQSHPEIHTYHEHQTLLENTPEEELNDEDKKLAWEEYNTFESMKNAPTPAVAFAPQAQAVVNASNHQNAAEHNMSISYNVNPRHLLPAIAQNIKRPLPPPPPYRPSPTVQYGPMHNVSSAPQMYPINLHNPVKAPALRFSNVAAPHCNINYPHNSIGSRQLLNAPAPIGNVVSAAATYHPPVIQVAPARHQLPVTSGSTMHYLPRMVQPPPARHRPPVSNRPVQSSSRLQTNPTLQKEWFQRMISQTMESAVRRNPPIASHSEIQQLRSPYAKPSSNGTTVLGNIETIDLSNQPESFNAQRGNVPSNPNNSLQRNQAQGEFNYTLNRFQ